jgi:hypothetical protein
MTLTTAAYAPYANPLKRSGDSLESTRSAPSHMLHRRAVSSTKLESDQQYSAPPTYTPNPGELENANWRDSPVDGAEYTSPYMASTPTLPSNPVVDTFSPAPVMPGVQPSLMRSTQINQPGMPPPVSSIYTSNTSSTKAKLELTGDLDGMSKGWSVESRLALDLADR